MIGIIVAKILKLKKRRKKNLLFKPDKIGFWERLLDIFIGGKTTLDPPKNQQNKKYEP
jgi:hypothetical protein